MMIRTSDLGICAGNETLRWDEMRVVGIRTTSDGPFAEDVFWQFVSSTGVFELPGSVVDGEVFAAMQKRLPGMDALKVIDAFGSTRERVFRVWHTEDSRWRWRDDRFGARFFALVGRLGGSKEKAAGVFERLRDAWSAPARAFHNLEHLTDCLGELDRSRVDPRIADVVELALWYHDVIYEPTGRDLEERSIERLSEDCAELRVAQGHVLAAAECIRATAHTGGANPAGPAAATTSDIDLSILGCDPLRFMEYEYAVEEEHAGVWRPVFILARGRLLASLTASPSIFRTAHFRERFESRARANISALLRSPRYRAHRWLGGLYRVLA
jgi:predicted metal-dependent HD superfamily phosphohydrolase